MKLPRGLLVLSSAVFGLTGLGYLVAPGLMLAVVGIPSVATTEFLLRTEGVALICAAAILWAARDGNRSQIRIVLFALSVFYVLGSLVDVAAFVQGVVGWASIPSAAARIGVGVPCLITAARLSRQP